MASEKEAKKRRPWLLPAVGAVLLAAVTAFAGGMGSRLADSIGSDEPPLISYSVELLEGRCRGGEFVPQPSLPAVLGSTTVQDWKALEGQPGAAQASINPVQVAIQGGTGRTITLTRIEFHVSRRQRPPGAHFQGACGDAFIGRSLEVDLDLHPPRVVDSNATAEGALGARKTNGQRPYSPIRFPWTVSVSDPLLLEIIASTESCDCTWRAEILWVSGSSQGTIVVDNGGAGYRVVGSEGLSSFVPSPYGWRRWRS
ncbi:MAG TPA: hypothetical protein VD761_08735 [Solirubrobacterales bacterium]|nr:hypothetical protein [Solirubrobacterales bacterium]